jgi:hypothetical protein
VELVALAWAGASGVGDQTKSILSAIKLRWERCAPFDPVDLGGKFGVPRLEAPLGKFGLQGLGSSDGKTKLSRRNMLADSGTDQTVQRTLVAE